MDVQRTGGNRRRVVRRLALGAALATGTALLGYMAFGLAGRAPAIDADMAWSSEVKKGEFIHEVTAAGTLVATEIRSVTNRSDGVVERVLVLPGQSVQPDDVLMEMSSPTLPDELQQTRSALVVAEAEERLQRAKDEDDMLNQQVTLAGIEVDYISAKFENDAKRKLAHTGAVSELDLTASSLKTEQQQRRFEAAKVQLERTPQMRAAQEDATAAKLAQQRRDLQRIERLIDGLKIRAGFAGVVQTVDVEAGKRVSAGSQVARVVNAATLVARVKVSERDASLVQVGQPARLEMARKSLMGKVSRIESAVQDRLVTLDISLDGTDQTGLRPDLSVTARIEIERVPQTLVIERPASLRDDQHSVRLFRLDGNGKHAVRRDVEVGRISARQIEIKKGLAAGDKVILADMTEWADETELRLR